MTEPSSTGLNGTTALNGSAAHPPQTFTGQVPQFDLAPTGPSASAGPDPEAGERTPSPTRPEGPRPGPGPDAYERRGTVTEENLVRSTLTPGGRLGDQAADRVKTTEPSTGRGTTSIADEVVEKLVGIATKSVPGVHDLGGDLARLIGPAGERGTGPETGRGISVRLDGRAANIKITLVIEYGHVIDTVTEGVRSAVIETVERMLTVDVRAVDILVDDVHVPDEVTGTGRRAAR